MKTKQHTNLTDILLISGILILAVIPRFFLLKFRSFELFDADQAIIGLMGKHILEGHPMIYFYGQGYMGSLEAFAAAAIYLFRGVNTLSVQLAPTIFYLAFLVVNYFLLKRVFNRETALASNLILALSAPTLTALSMLALGGYPETLFFGSLILLGLFPHPALSPSKGRGNKILLLTGIAAGIAFWVNNLILMYLIALAVFMLLKSDLWKKIYPHLTFRRIFLLEGTGLPIFLRVPLAAIHLFIAYYLIWQVISFFLGPSEWHLGKFSLETASPPFKVKLLKKMILLASLDLIILVLTLLKPRKTWELIKPSIPFFGGFLVGTAPAWLYYLIGGDGHRVIHGMGCIFAKDFPKHFQEFFVNSFLAGVLGAGPVRIPAASPENLYPVPSHPAQYFLFIPILIVSAIFLIRYFWIKKSEIGNFFRLAPGSYSYSFYPFILFAVVTAICLFSTVQATRHLIPVYAAVAFMFGFVVSQSKNKIIAWLCLALLLAGQAIGNAYFIQTIPDRTKEKEAHARIIDYFVREKIRGGYADYWQGYRLTFESEEKIILAVDKTQKDRYPAFRNYVDRLDKVAYTFRSKQAADEMEKQLAGQKISYQKVEVSPYWLVIVDRTTKSEINPHPTLSLQRERKNLT